MIAPILSLHHSTREAFEEKLASLRALSGVLQNEPSRRSFLSSDLREGLPRGAVTEISGQRGTGKTELILRCIAENPGIRVAWIEDRFTAYPCSFPQLGVQLHRLLFVEGGQEALWAAQQALQSQIFGIVVITSPITSVIELRRLQLAAEQSDASVVILSETARSEGKWPIALQVRVRHESNRLSFLHQRRC